MGDCNEQVEEKMMTSSSNSGSSNSGRDGVGSALVERMNNKNELNEFEIWER